MSDERINISLLINENEISWLQWRVVILCFFVALLDGFDTQVMAYVAPVISKEFSIEPVAMGVIFSAGFIGLMVGALCLSTVADRFGRKPVILISCALMGVFTLLTATADNLIELQVYRFLTGLGLGGVMPNLNSLTAEYAPARRRAFLMTLMFSGFGAGAVVGGFLSAPIIEVFGWRTVFIIGGVMPLFLILILAMGLPESIMYRVMRNKRDPEIGRALERMLSNFKHDPSYVYYAGESSNEEEKLAPLLLFRNGRYLITIGFWLTTFSALFVIYALYSWLPYIMREAGLSLDYSIYTTAIMNLGAVIGGLFFTYLIDRYKSFKVLPYVYFAAIVAVICFGLIDLNIALLFTTIFFIGVSIAGSQYPLNALIVFYYPTALRSTGLGWALAVGRTGAIVGPIMVGFLLSEGLSRQSIFVVLALPVCICLLVILMILSRLKRLSAQDMQVQNKALTT